VYENHATNAVLITQDGPSYFDCIRNAKLLNWISCKKLAMLA